jgi:uncharacterized protein YhjY with autotransporter beta-barrel domain
MRCVPVFVLVALLAGAPAWGQTLNTVGNDVQQPVAEAVQEICRQFVATYGSPGQVPDPLQRALFERCREMVQTANSVLENDRDTTFSIPGITTEAQLSAALQQIGTEELAAAGTDATEASRGRVLLQRLTALRHGATGVNVGDLNLRLGGHPVAAAALFPRMSRDNGPRTGRGVRPLPGQPQYARSVDNTPPAADPVNDFVTSERLGFFANGLLSYGERDTTEREDGFDFDVPGVTAGIDYRLKGNLILGGALGYESFDADFHTTSTVAGGDMQNTLVSLSLYSSYYGEHYYVDGFVSYGQNDYEMTREIDYPTVRRTAKANTEGSQYEVTGAVGYSGQHGAFQYSPFLRVSTLGLDIDAYTETDALELALSVEEQEIDSLLSILGGQCSWTLSTKSGVVIPHLRAEWYKEFEDDSRLLTAKYASDPFNETFGVPVDEPDEDYYTLGTGVSVAWKGGVRAFVDLETVLGLDNLTNYAATVGLRFSH